MAGLGRVHHLSVPSPNRTQLFRQLLHLHVQACKYTAVQCSEHVRNSTVQNSKHSCTVESKFPVLNSHFTVV